MGTSMGSDAQATQAAHDWKKPFVIDVRVPPEQQESILNYVIGILERNKFLSSLTKSTKDGVPILQYRLTGKDGSVLDIAVKFLADNIEVYYAPYPQGSVKDNEFIGLNLELETIIRSYFADQGKASLFLVFSPKMNLLPKKRESAIKKALGAIIFGNFLWFFVLIVLLGLFILPYLGNYTPLVLVAFQFVIVFFAGNLIKFRGEFEITADNQTIHIAELRMKKPEFDQVVRTCVPKMGEIKKHIYDSTLAVGKDLDQGTIVKALNDYGSVCNPELVRIKSVNVWALVKDLVSKFKFKMPSITLLNVLAPNAAATGIMPSRATVLVTSGLIATMSEDEIKTVLAHEFSHVRARDPLVLMALVTIQYLGGVYFILPLLADNFFFYLAYLFLSLTLLFFVAKFLEARADLDAAVITDQPRVLAESLRKLGLYKYQSHAFELIHAGEWVNFDTHPPLYYRIRTLENYDTSKKHHTFIEAVKGCVNGFIESLSGK